MEQPSNLVSWNSLAADLHRLVIINQAKMAASEAWYVLSFYRAALILNWLEGKRRLNTNTTFNLF